MVSRIRGRRSLVWLMASSLLLQACGSGHRLLTKTELTDPPAARTYRVTTTDGVVHDFISLHLEQDTLYGTERITSAVTEGEGEAARTSAWNRYEERQIPWEQVATVEAESSRKQGTGIFLAVGAIAVGVGAFILLSSTDDRTPSTGGGGGKDF